MQRAIILVLLSLFATVTIGVFDDIAQAMAYTLSLTRTDVEMCMNKTNVRLEDLEKMDEQIINDIHTPEIDESVMKVGCLFACLAQKKEVMTGSHINVDKLKQLLDSNLGHSFLKPKVLAKRNQVLDLCVDRVRSKINECEVAIQFTLCIAEFASR